MKPFAVLAFVCGPGRIRRLRCCLQTLVAFVGVGLLVTYIYDFECRKKSATSSDNKLRSSPWKTGFNLSIRSMALAEEANNNADTALPIFGDVQSGETENGTELASVGATEVSLQEELKLAKTSDARRISESSDDVETTQISRGPLTEVRRNYAETNSRASTEMQATTTPISEVAQTTNFDEASFVRGSQAPPDSLLMNSCGHEPPEGLRQVMYDSEELESTFNRTSTSKQIWSKIKPAMTSEERDTVRLLLLELMKICDLYNIRNYFIFSGTLLGSYRHHGLQPWDDDIDILMQHSKRNNILDVFRTYVGNYSQQLVVTFIHQRMKLFYLDRSIAITGFDHRWPFLDISFYHENETHIWELYVSENLRYHVTPKTLIFPLHLRPFESVMINSPRDSFAVLKSLFSDDQCVSLTWVHKREEAPPSPTISFRCDTMAHIYPFVHRREVAGGGASCVEESLWLNDTVLYAVLIEEPTYAISLPFRLALEQRSGSV